MTCLDLTFSHLGDGVAVFADYTGEDDVQPVAELQLPVRVFAALGGPMRLECVVAVPEGAAA